MTQPSKVLVVDDEIEILEIMNFELTELGYEVHTADHVDQALEKIENQKFDALISDMKMPEKSGFHLLKELKDHKNKPSSIIMFTGFSVYSTEDLIANGADAVLSKPIDFPHLEKTLKKLLEK